MQKINVPAGWIAIGSLPSCCARHGSPATHFEQRTFYSRPPTWVYALILPSLLIAAILAAVLRITLNGSLPACEECRADRRRFVVSVVAAWLITLALLVIAVDVHNSVLGVLFAVAALAALVQSFRRDSYRVSGLVTRDGYWVNLRGAHHAFVTQIAAALAGYATQTPSPTPVATAQPGYYPDSQTILPGG